MNKPAIALFTHDAKKDTLVTWVGKYITTFQEAQLFSTGTAGGRLLDEYPDLDLTRLKSGPLGGDQQTGVMIAESKLDALIKSGILQKR